MNLEDVATEHTTLRNCIKLSTQIKVREKVMFDFVHVLHERSVDCPMATTGLSRNRVSEIVGNTSFGNIDTLLTNGRGMEYIASHYNMDLALAWALRLIGKTDQEKFK